jgi:hypothetical protein
MFKCFVVIATISITFRSIKLELPKVPMLFSKPRTSLAGPGDIPIPKAAQNDQIDFETELAVVIGKNARDVKDNDALDYVLGCVFPKWHNYCNPDSQASATHPQTTSPLASFKWRQPRLTLARVSITLLPSVCPCVPGSRRARDETVQLNVTRSRHCLVFCPSQPGANCVQGDS